MIYVEIIEVDDVQGSPIPPKMINALRQTRSEENLPDYFGVQDFSGISFSLHPSADDDGDCWTQEDDAISLQVSKESIIFIGSLSLLSFRFSAFHHACCAKPFYEMHFLSLFSYFSIFTFLL